MKSLRKQIGFTLVEISIVLVIIGLLVGGILKSQQMIENAKIKNLMHDLDGILVAYQLYVDNTSSIPGDSNLDFLIDDQDLFWKNLRQERLIAGASSETRAPKHALQGDYSVGSGNPFLDRNWFCALNIRTDIVEMIDRQLDDGDALSGDIRTFDGKVYEESDSNVSLCRALN